MTSLHLVRESSGKSHCRAAGKIFPKDGSTKECLQPTFSSCFAPSADSSGLEKENRKSLAHNVTHGLTSLTSDAAGDLLNPKPKTYFQQRMLDKKEEHYPSRCSPLGKSRRDRAKLSSDVVVPNNFKGYGLPSERDMAAGEVINPPKTSNQVEEEAKLGHEFYRRTHYGYYVGEQCDRNYDWSSTNPLTTRFGIETPHDNDGRNVAKSLKWSDETASEKSSLIVSKKVDDFRERTQPQIGKVHDPIVDTRKVGPNHIYGIIIRPDKHGVGDLLHIRSPKNYLLGKDRQLGAVSLVRHQLKKANYHNFADLQTAFQYYDYDNKGYLDAQKIREACWRFNVPIGKELLGSLMHYCALEDGQDADDCRLDYTKFVNFLNWRDKFEAPSTQAVDEAGVPRLCKQIDKAMTAHVTSSSAINAVVGATDTSAQRTYGVPTVRSDMPAPQIKRISDNTDYGDEHDAYALISPSIYTGHGVAERDFFELRSREEIRRIFRGIGVKIDDNTFDKIWESAVALSGRKTDDEQKMSVESFRAVLDKIQAASVEDLPSH